MNSSKWSPEVVQLLEAAGWKRDRKVPLDERDLYNFPGIAQNEHARDVLCEFGGLIIGELGHGIDCAKSRVQIGSRFSRWSEEDLVGIRARRFSFYSYFLKSKLTTSDNDVQDPYGEYLSEKNMMSSAEANGFISIGTYLPDSVCEVFVCSRGRYFISGDGLLLDYRAETFFECLTGILLGRGT